MSPRSQPSSAPPSPPRAGDAFARVRAALRAVWPQVANPAQGLSVAERNLVLDGCGSDYRPLVDLLLDLGRELRPHLAARGSDALSASEWSALRAAQVHRIVATRYLQDEVARWAVEVWGGIWLGMAEAVTTGAVTTGAVTTTTAGTAGAVGAGKAAGRGLRTPVAVPATAVPAALRQVPSWAGGPVSFGVGKQPKASTLQALAARGRVVVQHGPPGPKWQPAERRAAAVFAALLVVCSGSMWVALERRPKTAAASASDAMPAAPAGDSAREQSSPAATDTSSSAAPANASSDEASSGIASTQPTTTLNPSSNTPSGNASNDRSNNIVNTAPNTAPGTAPSTAPNTAPGTAPVTDAHAIGYYLVPLPAARDNGRANGAAAGSRVRETGVAGRYRVVQQIRAVDGTENCEAVAGALAGGRISEEVVLHAPGQREFTISSRGVKGLMASDGYFEAGPRSGTTNNIAWRFRMRGRFTPQGFTAETETYTDATIRWGRQQTCVVTAELTATRLVVGPS